MNFRVLVEDQLRWDPKKDSRSRFTWRIIATEVSVGGGKVKWAEWAEDC